MKLIIKLITKLTYLRQRLRDDAAHAANVNLETLQQLGVLPIYTPVCTCPHGPTNQKIQQNFTVYEAGHSFFCRHIPPGWMLELEFELNRVLG